MQLRFTSYPNARRSLTLALFLFLSSAFFSPAMAHRVIVFAWVEGDTVYTESKFSGGKPVHKGEIRVTTTDGELLLIGETDENGEFSFKIPRKSALRIELIAGMGHKGEWVVPEAEVAAGVAPRSEPKTGGESEGAETEDAKPASTGNAPSPNALTPRGPTADEIEAAMERAVTRVLDRKLAPLTRKLSEMADPGPTLGDVMAGLGYIFGLAGVWVLAKSRKK